MSDEKNNPFSVRMEPEDKEKLIELIQESGRSNKDFMNALISAYELNKIKLEIPEANESIKKVEELTQLINDNFVNMSKQIKTTKESMNLQYTRDMEIYREKTESLKNENIKINEELDTLRNAYNDTFSNNEELNKHLSQLEEINKDKTSLVEEYKGKNDMLLSQLKQYEKYPEQLEITKKLLSDAQNKIIETENNLKIKDDNITRLTNKVNELIKEKEHDIIELKEKHNETIEELQGKHKDSLKQVEDKAELEKGKALLHLQLESQAKAQITQDNYNKTIGEYQQKYKALLGEIENSKANNKKIQKAKSI